MAANTPSELLDSIRRGHTVEARTATLLRGLLRQGQQAAKAGDYEEWFEQSTQLTPEYASAVAGTTGTATGQATSQGG